jgi:hypothetical protein
MKISFLTDFVGILVTVCSNLQIEDGIRYCTDVLRGFGAMLLKI